MQYVYRPGRILAALWLARLAHAHKGHCRDLAPISRNVVRPGTWYGRERGTAWNVVRLGTWYGWERGTAGNVVRYRGQIISVIGATRDSLMETMWTKTNHIIISIIMHIVIRESNVFFHMWVERTTLEREYHPKSSLHKLLLHYCMHHFQRKIVRTRVCVCGGGGGKKRRKMKPHSQKN